MADVYLNGKFIPVEQASISVLDRGFLFGDGIYEVIPVFSGRPLRASEHLERLYRSLTAIDLKVEQQPRDWHALLAELLQRNQNAGEHLAIYLQITRGCGPVRAHAYPDHVKPTVFAMVMPFQPNIRASGNLPAGRAITVADKRWQNCHIKSTSLLGNLLPYQKAKEAGAAEAILISKDGFVTEGSSSNVFAIIGERIVTPPLSPHILGGVTRALVLELAENDGRYICEERELEERELLQADEVWITSSSREILPITELNGAVVGDGQPGPVWKHIAALYRSYRDVVPERENDRTESAQN